MSQPHHFIFNELQRAIQKCVPIEPLIPFLLERNILKEADVSKYKGRFGMKLLTSSLRTRDFDTFVKFVDCIDLAGRKDPTVDRSIMNAIMGAVELFDKNNNTSYADQLPGRKEKQQVVEAVVLQPESNVDQPSQSKAEHPLGEYTWHGGLAPSDSTKGHVLLMPPFHYVGSIESAEFGSLGGDFHSFDKDFRIIVPPGAIAEGNAVRVMVGACSHGPFEIPHDCYLITGIFCVVADGEFIIPVTVVLQHCMEMPEYKRTPQIMLLRADFKNINSSGEYILSPIENPDISDSWPHLSFQISQFCVLCAVFKPQNSRRLDTDSSTDSTGRLASNFKRQMAIDVPSTETPSPQSSVEETQERDSPYNQSKAKHTASCKCQQCSSIDSEPGEPLLVSSEQRARHIQSNTEHIGGKRRASSKRKTAASYLRTESQEKRKCRLKYALLFFEPEERVTGLPFEVCIYACQDCYVSIDACRSQMSIRPQKWKEPLVISDVAFESDCISFEPDTNIPGWRVVPKLTPKIEESDIHIHQKSVEERGALTRQGLYPPHRVFEVTPEFMYSQQRLECRINICGANTSEYFTITAWSPPKIPYLPPGGDYSFQHQPISHHPYHHHHMPYLYNPGDPRHSQYTYESFQPHFAMLYDPDSLQPHSHHPYNPNVPHHPQYPDDSHSSLHSYHPNVPHHPQYPDDSHSSLHSYHPNVPHQPQYPDDSHSSPQSHHPNVPHHPQYPDDSHSSLHSYHPNVPHQPQYPDDSHSSPQSHHPNVPHQPQYPDDSHSSLHSHHPNVPHHPQYPDDSHSSPHSHHPNVPRQPQYSHNPHQPYNTGDHQTPQYLQYLSHPYHPQYPYDRQFLYQPPPNLYPGTEPPITQPQLQVPPAIAPAGSPAPDNESHHHREAVQLQRSLSNEEKECISKHVTVHAIRKVYPLVRRWKRFGRSLGVEEVKIVHLSSDYSVTDGVEECCYQLLLHWLKTNDSSPTFGKLIAALEEADEMRALRYVLGNLCVLADD